MSRNIPMIRTLIAAAALLPVLLAGTGCAPLGSDRPGAILEKVADGDYDVGIRYPAKRARYVMIVEEDEDGFVVTNRPAGAREVDTAPAPVAAPQRNDRVLAPCAEATGNWYRHTPAGYVCVGQSAPGTGG
ncbi:hypothetical protein JJL56_19315 [Azospirillum sp. YIM DDC1]|uniref:Lipoprotein n=2 Tax=Azospirillum aestuarii TaxID=2802052 RepID=A0ABS1I269_9PROT|nr:hypothetical protein [Azospirillum brasilense]MBK4721016.1 hypothetical protein [Azospirillum aestuarii]